MDLVLKGLVEGYEEWKAEGGTGGALAGSSNVSSLELVVAWPSSVRQPEC